MDGFYYCHYVNYYYYYLLGEWKAKQLLVPVPRPNWQGWLGMMEEQHNNSKL